MEKVEAEQFSVASARQALMELAESLPRAKKLQFFGHVNEIDVVLSRIECEDKAKEYKP